MTREDGSQTERRQGYDRRQAHVPWYKSRETRLNLILLTVWLGAILMGAIAIGVLKDVHLNQRIENRQINQRDRTCLIIQAEHLPDQRGLCSPATLAHEDRGR